MAHLSTLTRLYERPSARRALTHVRGAARAALLLASMLAAASFFYLRSARASVGEQVTRFGLDLLAWQDTNVDGEARHLFVNGIDFRLVTASTTLPVHQALQRFHVLCRERGGLSDALGALGTKSAAPAPSVADGVLSWESGSAGIVACLDTGHPLGLEELVARAKQFGATGDLSAIGELRYVLARNSGSNTTLLVLWTEGSAPLRHAFPSTGDVPGIDPPDVSRPPRTRRLISAAERGQPYSLTSYAVTATSAGELASWYERELGRAGWTVDKGAHGIVARMDDRTIVVRIATGRGGLVASIIGLSR